MGLGQEKHLAWKTSIGHLPSGHGYPWESASDPESPQPQPSWVPCEASLNRNLRAGEVGVCPSSARRSEAGRVALAEGHTFALATSHLGRGLPRGARSHTRGLSGSPLTVSLKDGGSLSPDGCLQG